MLSEEAKGSRQRLSVVRFWAGFDAVAGTERVACASKHKRKE